MNQVALSQVAPLAGEAFEDRMLTILNGGALCLMISLGHRSGLFDAMQGQPPAGSAAIASAAGLQERYVREWLGAMVTGDIVRYDPAEGTYWLPDEHAALLTQAETPDNLAAFTQYIPLLGSVEDDVLACFREGGGVPYERYGRFHQVMSEDSGQTVLPALREHILPLVPGITEKLEQGIRVLDLGCGRGKALNLMAGEFPRSRFVGMDLSREAVDFARREAAEQGHDNIRFEQRDLSTFDEDAEPGAFDLVTTFDAVHDQARPDRLLRGIRRSLTDDGVYLAQDIRASSRLENNFDHPIAPTLYTVSCMHCMTVSLAQGGHGLGAMWGREQAETYFREAGFSDIRVHELEHDFQNYYYVCRP